MVRRALPAAALAALLPAACGQAAPTSPSPSGEHALRLRIAAVSREGRNLHVAWEAPGATHAVVSFSVDGATFRTVARSAHPQADFTPASAHGVIRVLVMDGKRRTASDYRI